MEELNKYRVFSKSVWYLGAPCQCLRSHVTGKLCQAAHLAGECHPAEEVASEVYMELQVVLRLLEKGVRSAASRQPVMDRPYGRRPVRTCCYRSFGCGLRTAFLENNGFGPFIALVRIAEAASVAREHTMSGPPAADDTWLECVRSYWDDAARELQILCRGTRQPSRLFVSLTSG